MRTKRISGIIFLALLGAAINGQVRQPHSLYFMETIPQISQMNPAFQPRANGYLMLPSVNIDFLSDIAVKDMLQKQDNKWRTPFEKQYDYDMLRKSIGKQAAMFNFGTDIDIIGYGLRVGDGYFSVGISEHISGNFALPGDIFNITDKGFPNGATFDFSPLHFQAIMYKQFLVGYSRKLNDKLTVGMNIKPLFGQFAFATDIQNFNMRTKEVQWDVSTTGNVYSSLPCDVKLDAEGKIEDVKLPYEPSDGFPDKYKFKDWLNDYGKDLFQDYGLAFHNPGIAFDLGVSYRIDERLTASLSVNNLGFISWKEDLNSISFDGKYKIDGLYYDATSDDEIKDLFNKLGESIADAMKYKTENSKFKTALPPVLHAGASYRLTESLSAGLLSRTVFWKNCIRQSFNLSAYFQPYSFVAFNAGATWQMKSNVFLGGGLTFLLGPLQIYILADHVPVYYSSLTIDDKRLELSDNFPIPIPERLKTVTMRVGFNLIFGRHGYTNRPMLDRGKNSWN